MRKLVAVYGDSESWTLPIRQPQTDESGLPVYDTKGNLLWQAVDLSAVRGLWFTVKARREDDDEDALIQKGYGVDAPGLVDVEILDAEEGVASAMVRPEDWPDRDSIASFPVEWYYDFQLRESTGRTTTIDSGVLLVLPDVTRA